MRFFKKLLPIIIVILLSYWSVRPLFGAGFFPIHDDTQVARVFEMHKSLSDGMFPVRWIADFGYGYGYPIFNFYAPLAYYIGASFTFLGADALVATKLMMGLGIILAGVFMYLLAAEFWGKAGGVVAGLLYVYAPYHALNIYVRGAVSELWAYAFVPLGFLGVYKIFITLKSYADLVANSKLKTQNSNLHVKTKKLIWYWVCVSSMSYAAIILSHNLTAMMVTPFLFTYAAILYIRLRMKPRIYKPYLVLFGLLVGILLSAFYWLPVITEIKFTNVLSVVGGGSDYIDHFVCLKQLWNSPWGFGGSAPECIDGLSFKIGKIHILLSLISLAALIPMYRRVKTEFTITTFFIISLLFSTFLNLRVSQFIWDAIPHMAFFQFPWRFLLPVSFFASFLGGTVFWIAEKVISDKHQLRYLYWIIYGVVVITIVVFNM